MNYCDKILRGLDEISGNTITCDIFDTILLRRMWPEDVQFLKVAEKWLPMFHNLVRKDITAYQLYAWRQYVRREILGAKRDHRDKEQDVDFDTNLTEWFSGIVQCFTNLHDVRLNRQQQVELVKRMIEVELETEKENLRPNWRLIKAIEKIKSIRSDVKCFFVSDMYLSSKQIAELLRAFNIEIFDGGISSTDAQQSKASKKLYYFLQEKDPFQTGFEMCKNIHLGDNKVSDYKNVLLTGGKAILIPITTKRKIKTYLGRLKIHRIKQINKKMDAKNLAKLKGIGSRNFAEFWRNYGALFAQPLFEFLFHIGNEAKFAPKTTNFLMVSSEANLFYGVSEKWFANLLKSPNIEVAAKLNRRTMIRALVWAVVKQDVTNNAHTIWEVVSYGEIRRYRVDICKFIFGDNYPMSELLLNSKTEKEFFLSLIKELKLPTNRKYLKNLKNAYDYVLRYLPKNKTDDVVIVDVGWGGTVQVLYDAFYHLHGYTGNVSSSYLGTFPSPGRFAVSKVDLRAYLMPNVHFTKYREIWNAMMWEYAYTSKIQFPGDEARIKYIHEGFAEGVRIFRQTRGAPKETFEQNVVPCLKRLIHNPTRYEVMMISSIEFDVGFVEKSKYQVVDTSMGQLEFWKMLIFHPKTTIRNVIFKANCWPMGYIVYYRVIPLKWAIQLIGKIKKRYYL